jgi:hypothetical protein
MNVAAGTQADWPWQTPNRDGTFGCGFISSDAITASVWAGDSTTVLATPSVVWGGTLAGVTYTAAQGAPITLWTITLGPSDAAGLPPGVYRCQVFGTHNGAKGRLWDGLLDVVDSAGSSSQGGLITLTFAGSALTRTRLSREERDFLPSLITIASDEVVKWCGQRDFIRQTYTEEYTAELDGRVMLRQMPVNNVLRILGYPQTVLCITGSTGSMQQAWISYTTTGDWYTNTLSFTGIVLNSVSSGVSSSTTLSFASYTTIAQLAAAIGSVAGWTANVQGAFGLLPVTALQPPGGITAQGALDDDGVELQAYTEDLTTCRVDNAIGALWVGRRRIVGTVMGRWGPEEAILDDVNGDLIGRVQVTYDAGFTVVPSVVQHATAMIVKGLVEEARHDHALLSESISGAGSRAYQVAADLVMGLPRPVIQRLSQYRMARAR